jgi:hypothetical protein
MRLRSSTTSCRPLWCAVVLVWLAAAQVHAAGDFFAAGVAARDGITDVEAREVTLKLRRLLGGTGRAASSAEETVSFDDAARELEGVEARLKDARNAFDEMDQKACIQAVQDALDKYDRGPAWHVASPAMANGLLLMAQAQEKSGQAKKSRALYSAVVSRWPDHDPDPNVFPPNVIEAVRRARADLDGGGSANLELVSNPPGARVFVDGTERGRTPMAWRGGKGKHWLRVEGEDGGIRTITVNVGETPKLDVTLEHPAEKASQKLLTLLAEKRPEKDIKKAAVGVGARSGANGILAGVLLPQGGAKGPVAVLGRFDAPQGTLTRTVKVPLPTDGTSDKVLNAALATLTDTEPPLEDDDTASAREILLGKGGASSAATSNPATATTTTPSDTKPATAAKDEPGAAGTPARGGGFSVPIVAVAALAAIPAGALIFALVAGAAGAGLGTALYFYLYPPNPYGTNVRVKNEGLTQ